jgi:hypothetical protein
MAIDNAALRYLIDTYLTWSGQQGIRSSKASRFDPQHHRDRALAASRRRLQGGLRASARPR